mmetsp:Transcript_120075/g.285254  ORF Transcript_120075/g.285254 Transcript_120075/m.285254 type:complete len:313 (-) Transcript_120075:766-1704(-)
MGGKVQRDRRNRANRSVSAREAPRVAGIRNRDVSALTPAGAQNWTLRSFRSHSFLSSASSKPRRYFKLQPASKLGPKGIFQVQKKGWIWSDWKAFSSSSRNARSSWVSWQAYLASWKVPAENSVTATWASSKSFRSRDAALEAQSCSLAWTSGRGAEQLKPPPCTVRPSQSPLLQATYQWTSATAQVRRSSWVNVVRNHGTAECSNWEKAVSMRFTYSLTCPGRLERLKSSAVSANQDNTSCSFAKSFQAFIWAGSFMSVKPATPCLAKGSSPSTQAIIFCATQRPTNDSAVLSPSCVCSLQKTGLLGHTPL